MSGQAISVLAAGDELGAEGSEKLADGYQTLPFKCTS